MNAHAPLRPRRSPRHPLRAHGAAAACLLTALLALAPAGRVEAQGVPVASPRLLDLHARLRANEQAYAYTLAERPSNQGAKVVCAVGGGIMVVGLATLVLTGLVATGFAISDIDDAVDGAPRHDYDRLRKTARVAGYVVAAGAPVLVGGVIWALAEVPGRRPYNQQLRALRRERRGLLREIDQERARATRTLSLGPSVRPGYGGVAAVLRF